MAFIRLRLNTLQLAAGLKGKVNRAEAHQSEGGLLLLYHFNVEMATAQFRFDTPTACGGELHFFLQDLGIKHINHFAILFTIN
jgi:hypothetical protein